MSVLVHDACDGRKLGQWYLHLFAPQQPDLNWDNPGVRAEFDDILRFWFDLGIDGFRIDVAHGMAKDPALPDLGLDEFSVLTREGQQHRDRQSPRSIPMARQSLISLPTRAVRHV